MVGGGISGTLDSPENGLPRMSRTAAGQHPIPAKSVAAATIKSGAVIANATPHLKPASLDFRETRVTPA